MKGSTRHKDGKCTARIDVGRVNGQRKQKEWGGFATKKEAEKKLIEMLSELNSKGRITESPKMTFSELFEEFITNEAVLTRKYATVVRYKSLFKNHYKNEFGYRYIDTLTPQELQKFIVEKSEKLSEEYVRSLYNFLLVLYGYAEKYEYIKENPIKKVEPPRQPRSVAVKIYSKEELEMLHNRLKTTNLLTPFMLGLHLGIRAGECYALRWSDFDFDKNTVTINKQLQKENKRWSFTTTKTVNSDRTITFGETLKTYLLATKNLQEQKKLFYDDYYHINKIVDVRDKKRSTVINIDDLVNIKDKGDLLTPHSNKVISRIAKTELEIDFKYHNLRHTHGTVLLEQGLNPKYISQRLGHSKLEFALRLYTHVTRKMESDSKKALDTYFDFE